ncbi:MAG: class I SAM-dependent methyltransferase [Bacteroidetes bacterium]|nr:class I SAM-dependent methyltransferase [Bacteroidota bacterium]
MNSILAPIVLFVYNRPWHTKQTLEALTKNELADESILYVFADGLKNGVSENEKSKIAEVRNIVVEKRWCKEIILIESAKNKGLANSVIEGVTEIINKYGKIIVIEDDLVTAKEFLRYMNEALNKYEQEEKVMQISGHCFPAKNIKKKNSCFFLPMTTSWGWATWKRAWNQFDAKATGYEILKTDKLAEKKFNLDNSYPLSDMLFKQMETNEIDSWAIRWWWSVAKEKGFVLFPDRSLVKNIGFDTEGTHTKESNPFLLKDFNVNYGIKKFPDKVRTDESSFCEIKKYLYDAANKKNISKRNNLIFMIKSSIRVMAKAFGFEIRRFKKVIPQKENSYMGFDLEVEAYSNIELIRPYTMLTYPRLVTLFQQVVFCERNKIEGCFVECGTWKGGAVGLMALANLKNNTIRRHIHLFDSFEGIPEPDELVDGARALNEVRSVKGETKGRLVAVKNLYETFADGIGTLEINKKLMEEVIGYDKSFLHYHKGWFQDTVPKDALTVGKIAILRLDGDWYASTKVCLDHLFDNVVSGGFVIIDDYGTYEGCKKAVDEFMQSKNIKSFLIHIDASARYFIKQ